VNNRPKRSRIVVFAVICASFCTALPTRGSYKELVITYESGGKKQIAEYRENSTFTLQFKK